MRSGPEASGKPSTAGRAALSRTFDGPEVTRRASGGASAGASTAGASTEAAATAAAKKAGEERAAGATAAGATAAACSAARVSRVVAERAAAWPGPAEARARPGCSGRPTRSRLSAHTLTSWRGRGADQGGGGLERGPAQRRARDDRRGPRAHAQARRCAGHLCARRLRLGAGGALATRPS